MKLLIVSATEAEITPFLDWITHNAQVRSLDVLITGVGMTDTAYSLTKKLAAARYDLALQVGVGGSFDARFVPGDLVSITSDLFGDLGAEDHENYLDIFGLGLANKDEFPFSNGRLEAPQLPHQQHLPPVRVSGLTVNTVSGSEPTIKRRREKYDCAIETMEGAAFHYVCLRENVPFAQVRAISNMVIPRDKSQWKMKDAIINLNNWLIDFIEQNVPAY
jgi:futalosine hydrolase